MFIYNILLKVLTVYEKIDWIKMFKQCLFEGWEENPCNTPVPFLFPFSQCNKSLADNNAIRTSATVVL